MVEEFEHFSKLTRLIILAFPFVNWFTEGLLRWIYFIENTRLVDLLMALLATFLGLFLGWADFVFTLLGREHLVLMDTPNNQSEN